VPLLRRLGVAMLALVGLAFAAVGVDDLRLPAPPPLHVLGGSAGILWALHQVGAGVRIPVGLLAIGLAGAGLCLPRPRAG
jgi:hypothetical protein